MKKQTSITLALLSALAVPVGYAEPVQTSRIAQADPRATSAMTEAEVRKVDKEAAKITLKHGEIKNLEMPAMTMVFQVKDKAMLDKVKTGDKVRFSADKTGGSYVITQIELK